MTISEKPRGVDLVNPTGIPQTGETLHGSLGQDGFRLSPSLVSNRVHHIECDLDEDCTCWEGTMVYALDKNGLWHSTSVTYPAQAKTSCCNQKLECVAFVTNLEIEAGQKKCSSLINMEKRGQQFAAFTGR